MRVGPKGAPLQAGGPFWFLYFIYPAIPKSRSQWMCHAGPSVDHPFLRLSGTCDPLGLARSATVQARACVYLTEDGIKGASHAHATVHDRAGSEHGHGHDDRMPLDRAHPTRLPSVGSAWEDRPRTLGARVQHARTSCRLLFAASSVPIQVPNVMETAAVRRAC